uniref:Epstein-Barr virus-like protein n=1 Tax=Oryza sativa subsp. japonica TaxID=39947 RepID=Q6K2L1_ORYSJ|nr:Epstein-Barr virus-like protein [Oryza sativa Japonica Group]BAD22461.1 Epstein-Barr virus-like protein [Oryza sativa Japonica Group]
MSQRLQREGGGAWQVGPTRRWLKGEAREAPAGLGSASRPTGRPRRGGGEAQPPTAVTGGAGSGGDGRKAAAHGRSSDVAGARGKRRGGEELGMEKATATTKMAGRRRRGMDSSPAREGDRVPVGFQRREAVTEMAHTAAELAAVAAWRGGGPSGDGTRPEMGGGGGASGERRATGRRHGRARRNGEKGEGDAGKLYRGSKGADMAGKPPDLAGDVGEKREKVGGEFKSNPAHLRARVRAGRCGGEGGDVGVRCGRGVEARRGECGGAGGFGGGCRRGAGGWRKGTT